MYELIILSLLMEGPAHGYLVARIIDNMIGPFAAISNGRLYPLFAQLEAGGLIAPDASAPTARAGGRGRRRYAITAAGRERFRQLMLDTASHPGDYRALFLYKSRALTLLAPAERQRILDHYHTFCRAHLHHCAAKGDELRRYAEGAGDLDAVRPTLQAIAHVAAQWRLELAWAERLWHDEGGDAAHDGAGGPTGGTG